MREPLERTIDGEKYTFCQLPAKKSLKLMTRIVRIIGAPIGAALGELPDGDKVSMEVLLDRNFNMGAIVAALCDRLDEDEVEAIVDTLLSQVIHEGAGEISKQVDTHFAGRLPHLLKVLAAALSHEYGDFLAGGDGQLVARFRKMVLGTGTIPA